MGNATDKAQATRAAQAAHAVEYLDCAFDTLSHYIGKWVSRGMLRPDQEENLCQILDDLDWVRHFIQDFIQDGSTNEKTVVQCCYISLDNGVSYLTAEDAAPLIDAGNLWDEVYMSMDADVREITHEELAPCTNAQFLARYLELAEGHLVIG